MAAGDKGGLLGFWSLPSNLDLSSLPELEGGMRDISDVGDCCQFKLSNENVIDVIWWFHRPITRLFYGEDTTKLYCCSYDKSIKLFDIQSMKFETIFKLNENFDSDIFIHHCIPIPSQNQSFFISLSNGYFILLVFENREILTIDTRDGGIQACFQAHSKKVNTVLLSNLSKFRFNNIDRHSSQPKPNVYSITRKGCTSMGYPIPSTKIWKTQPLSH